MPKLTRTSGKVPISCVMQITFPDSSIQTTARWEFRFIYTRSDGTRFVRVMGHRFEVHDNVIGIPYYIQPVRKLGKVE